MGSPSFTRVDVLLNEGDVYKSLHNPRLCTYVSLMVVNMVYLYLRYFSSSSVDVWPDHRTLIYHD